jgi:hypothetical protein
MADILVAKSSFIFECKRCDYNTSKKCNFDKHNKTKKHIDLHLADASLQKVAQPTINASFLCNCGKIFQHRQSLFKHRNKCSRANEDVTKNDIIKQLLLQNQQLIFENKEFKEMMFEQSNKMIELANKPTTIANINTNCNNKNQFNLQVFLNDKCKNAMNMSDFLDTIQIEDDDFENIGKLGYIQGISNIFIKGLKDLDETVRPMHCSDIKRETLYIKDNDTWDKDDSKQKVKNVIAMIAHKNIKYIPIWTDNHPEALDGTNKKNDQYMRIANQVTTAITPDDDSGINKIIRNVASQILIDKEKN